MKEARSERLHAPTPVDDEFQARMDAAVRETELIIAADPERDIADPTLPIYKVAAEDELTQEQAKFEAGSGIALLGAIRICANHDLPLPQWAARAYIKAYDKVLSCTAGSWDEVFGRPYKKGTHLAALRKRRMNRIRVWLAMKHRGERPIDEQLFEDIGKPLGLGKTLVSELYYEGQRQFGRAR